MTIRLTSVTPTGPFDWRWPVETEHFERGWDAMAEYDGSRYRIRHAIGRYHLYGRWRVHSTTWVAGEPIVEGVEADDYSQSRALLSLLKLPDMRLVRTVAEVPRGYECFDIVTHRDEIDARYAKKALAVKIREDDLERWAEHAILRFRQRSLPT